MGEDEERIFPHGKWATIHHIDQQLSEVADAVVAARALP